MLEVTSRGTLDPTLVVGEFGEFIANLNIAAASGKQFVCVIEVRPDLDGGEGDVALETRNITRIRPVTPEDEIAFVGR